MRYLKKMIVDGDNQIPSHQPIPNKSIHQSASFVMLSLNCTPKACHPNISGGATNGGFLKWGYPLFSSIFNGIFPEINHFGVPPFMETSKYPTNSQKSNEINVSHMVICCHSMLHTSDIGVLLMALKADQPQLHWNAFLGSMTKQA